MDNPAKEILIRALDDWMCLAEVAGVLQHYEETSEISDSVRNSSLAVLKQLLDKELIEFGNIYRENPHFRSWALSSDETITRISDEWKSLGRSINLNDIGWLSLTEKGKQKAKLIIENGEAPPGVLTES
jgi:hypothetical protein